MWQENILKPNAILLENSFVCLQEGESLYHNELSKANVEIVLWGTLGVRHSTEDSGHGKDRMRW